MKKKLHFLIPILVVSIFSSINVFASDDVITEKVNTYLKAMKESDTKVFDNPMAPVTAPTGVNLMQLFVNGSIAREVAKNHTFGFSGILASLAELTTRSTCSEDSRNGTSSKRP